MCFQRPDIEFVQTPWYEILENRLSGERSTLPLDKVIRIMRKGVIYPAIIQLDSFFSLYSDFQADCVVNTIPDKPYGFSLPAVTVKILDTSNGESLCIFEYKLFYIMSPEDPEYLVLKCSGKLPAVTFYDLIGKSASFRSYCEKMNGFTEEYPSILTLEEISAENLLQNFAIQFANATSALYYE